MVKQIERRMFTADMEVRDAPDGTVGLRGYAAVFDAPAHGEVVRRSAFNRTLAQRDNVKLLVNHDGVPLASTGAGTMTLSVDDRGLLVDVPSLDMANPTAQELVSAMRRGDINQMSFAFTTNDAPVVDGVRELREVVLFDVSVVTYPWYDTTSVGLNEMDRALLALRALTPEQRALINIEVNVEGSSINDSSSETSTDSSVDNSTETETGGDGMCPTCGQPLPADPASTVDVVAPAPDGMASARSFDALARLEAARALIAA